MIAWRLESRNDCNMGVDELVQASLFDYGGTRLGPAARLFFSTLLRPLTARLHIYYEDTDTRAGFLWI